MLRVRVVVALLASVFGVVDFEPKCIAANLYVSTTGSDAWPGTAAQPWRTLQFAAGQVGPGDKVTVRAGATPAASSYAGFHLTADGMSGAPIEFFAEPGVRINAPNPIRPDHGINLEDASHIIIDGFEVFGMNRAGIRSVGVDGDTFASHVTIRNVHSHDNVYWGILTGFVNDVLIEDNVTSGSAVEHGIYVSNSGDRPIIRNNTVFDNRGNGIHMNGDESLGGDGLISNAVVSGNVIYNNAKLDENGDPGGGSGINMDGVRNSRIENNLLYNNHAGGISLYSIDGGGGSNNNVVVNNTIYQAADGRWAVNIRDASTGNTVLNNILLHAGTRGAITIWPDSMGGFTSDYNVVTNRFTRTDGASTETLAQWRSNTGQDMHSVAGTAAQLFVNPTSDFHLLPTVAAINAGTATQAPTVDLDGRLRPNGGAFDVGAYEWFAAVTSGDFNSDGVVNAADFAAWRKTNGTPAGYQQWRQNFGAGGGGGGGGIAVPEPSTAALLGVGMLIAATTRRWMQTL